MDKEEQDILASDFERSIINSALNRIEGTEPDVEREWKALRKGLRRRKNVWTKVWHTAAIVAACSLLFIMIRNLKPISNGTLPPLSSVSVKPAHIYTPANDGSVVTIGNEAATTAKSESEPNEMVELKTPVGKDLHATLSDGTTVWLNTGSTLRLYKYFSEKERRVRLSGEAYFNVQHNAERPFIVETDYFTVNDIGTAFNVKAYSKSEAWVALVEGKVTVQTSGNPIELSPGQQASITKGEIKVTATDIYPLTKRKEGLFYFHDAPLRDIMVEIGRWYGRSVVFENADNMNLRIHFVDDRKKSLDEIISDLNAIDGVQAFVGTDDITVR